MDEYEIKMDIAVQKTVRVSAATEDQALEQVYKLLEAKNIDRNRIQELQMKRVEKKIESASPSKMTN
jgi:ribosomal protein L20A (L18A)